MQRYRYEIDNVRAHLPMLWAVIGLQLIIILALWFGLEPGAQTTHRACSARSAFRCDAGHRRSARGHVVCILLLYIFPAAQPVGGRRRQKRLRQGDLPGLALSDARYRADLVADKGAEAKQGEAELSRPWRA